MEININSNNVLQTLCENSQDIIESDSASEDLDLKFEVQEDELVECHVQTEKIQPQSMEVVQNSDPCQYFLINHIPASNKLVAKSKTNGIGGRLVCPKIEPQTESTSAMIANKRRCLFDLSKKRDDKRRATHNEVERRRRDKINNWIFKLKEMMPESATEVIATESKSKQSANDSKSDILIKACSYIKQMQEELSSLNECLKENDDLREKVRLLEEDNEELKKQLPVTVNENV